MSRNVQTKKLLSLDLSTTCTGYAVFDCSNKTLIEYGTIKPKVKGISKLKYPLQQLEKMISLSCQIMNLIYKYEPSNIVIEEIAGSKQRLGQKVLDGLHWVLLMYMKDSFPFENIHYYDVTGAAGWRTHLKLKLTDEDKEWNRESRKLNKSLAGKDKLPIRGPKHLSTRYVNFKYNLNLNVDQRSTDGDIADAVSIGDAFLQFKFTG